MRSLQGKVLIVTGASSGIGAATAVEAARCGMKVTLAARRAAQLEEVADKVRGAGGQTLVLPTDVADARAVDHMVHETVRRFGRIDVLFANAGFGVFQRGIEDTSAVVERRMWAVNYFGAVDCIRQV